MIDLDAEVAVPLGRIPGSGVGGVALQGVLAEGPTQAVVHMVDVGSFAHGLVRTSLKGPAPVAVPSGAIALVSTLDDEALLLTIDGLLGRVDDAGGWSPIWAVGASAFFSTPLADGRVATYENVDVSGYKTSQLAVASLDALPVDRGDGPAGVGPRRVICRLDE